MSAATCTHEGARTLYNVERGIAFRADCGDRRVCVAARNRRNREMRERLSLVDYLRTPDLWTFTARTREQDALIEARELIRERRRRGESVNDTAERIAPLCMYRAEDRGVINRENLAIFNRALERVVRAVARQAERERHPGYRSTRHAAMLRNRYGNEHVARGRPGAALRIRVREAGELLGRLHAHAASDFDYLDKRWLDDHCRRCGLGFCEFERRNTKVMRAAARFSGRAVRSRTIGLYLSKYLSIPDDRRWPWPTHARLVSSARKVLPPRPPKPGWAFKPQSVAGVAVDLLGAVAVDVDVCFYSRDRDPTNRLLERGPPCAA
jgi:hypothetical protein